MRTSDLHRKLGTVNEWAINAGFDPPLVVTTTFDPEYATPHVQAYAEPDRCQTIIDAGLGDELDERIKAL